MRAAARLQRARVGARKRGGVATGPSRGWPAAPRALARASAPTARTHARRPPLRRLQAFDLGRLQRMALWGACFAPLAHVWYGRLDKIITATGTVGLAMKVAADQVRRGGAVRCGATQERGGGGVCEVRKGRPPLKPLRLAPTALWPTSRARATRPPALPPHRPPPPQLIWTPPINTLFFLYSNWMVTGNADAAVQDVQEKLWPTLKVNWVVWPVLQAVNMSVVPLQYRLLYINVCSIFWSAFLSGQANTGAKKELA